MSLMTNQQKHQILIGTMLELNVGSRNFLLMIMAFSLTQSPTSIHQT